MKRDTPQKVFDKRGRKTRHLDNANLRGEKGDTERAWRETKNRKPKRASSTARASRDRQAPGAKLQSRRFPPHLVGHLDGVVVGAEADKRLLAAVGADQGVDLDNLDVVQLLHGQLDLGGPEKNT